MPVVIILLVALLSFGGVGGCMAFYPQYNVYSSRMAGQAQLAEAEGNRQIAVRAAMAKRDSAKMEADAEIIRAKGVAEANRIVAQGLGGPEGYLRYLYINNLENSKGQIIYVPTEAGLPILEAGKRPRPQ
ncbi:membrane protease subunit [Tardibacter chloracetimidivorans]|uniref:Membrane protease subunit n=1 Tax=Tardibacter chloracetimidivorans TaxID=1921510 RepID=A0A1L3ZSH4_9SPHN|nr:membrane protease subunit [Tardibacter chloracetimidivorans]API58559.1 membrane protease subunit [Tardibacter chloracetimidivorans]